LIFCAGTILLFESVSRTFPALPSSPVLLLASPRPLIALLLVHAYLEKKDYQPEK
jgi:hypothetical protein